MRARALWKNLAFSAVGVGMCFLLLEGAARLMVRPRDTDTHREHERLITVLGLPALNDTMEFDPRLFWRLKPDLRGFRVTGRIREHAVDFTVSTHGTLRSPPVSPHKKGLRLLALGDSCTFGLGVDDGQTWPAQLEELLRRQEIEADVINAGVPGYTAFQGLRLLETRGLDLKPDLVIVSFGFNDMDREMPRSDPETARTLAVTQWESLLIRSRLYYGLKQALAPVISRGEDGTTEGRPRLAPEEFYETLAAIEARCEAGTMGMIFLVWPYEAQVVNRYADLVNYQAVAARFCRDRGVPAVNLVQAFIEAKEPLFIDHIHANAAGCRVAAEAVLPVVVRWARDREARSKRDLR